MVTRCAFVGKPRGAYAQWGHHLALRLVPPWLGAQSMGMTWRRGGFRDVTGEGLRGVRTEPGCPGSGGH